MRIEIMEQYIDWLLRESTPACPMWNVERLRNGEKPAWNYIDGCMMNALLKLYERTGEERCFRFVCDFLDTLVDKEGGMTGFEEAAYNLDFIFSGNALIDVYQATGKEKYRKAMNKLRAQLANQPRTTEGNYWHKKIYPHQVWLDGLYMAQIFRARWDKYFGDASEYPDIFNQFVNVRKRMFDEDTRLYRHAYDSAKKMFWADERGLSKNVWLRGVGWFAAALIDVAEAFPEDFAEGRAWMGKTLTELFKGMLPYLDNESGMFLQVVDYPKGSGNYPEMSGSALIAYAMMKSARLGLVDESWRRIGAGLFEHTREKYLKETPDGFSLGGICLSAGLGPEGNTRRDGSYAYYISEPVVENEAKGIAPFLYCYAEILYDGLG